MRTGVTVPNCGPGTDPATPVRWARLVGSVPDPFGGDPGGTGHPEVAWHALAAVAARLGRAALRVEVGNR